MSTLSHSVKFSDQPYSQNERFQVHVPELDEASLLQSSVQNHKGQNGHAYDDLQYQNNYNRQGASQNNYSTHQSAQQQMYSPHYSHHARMQQTQDIEKQFNYSGSRLRSPHHNPSSKVQARLRQGMNMDSQYNQGYGYEPQSQHNHAEGEHCPAHCQHDDTKCYSYGNNSKYNSVSGDPKNKSKLLNYPQPYGSGQYSNQLEMRTAHAKTANNFFNTNGKRQAYTSHENVRRNLNGTNKSTTTFNSLMQNKRTQEKLREKLYFDERTKTIPKTTIKNGIIENIVSDGEVFTGNKQLLNSVFKLKSLNLLKQHESHINRYNGVGKFPFVFNDYHSKSTNNGYSRQEKGGFFFTK